MNDCRSGKVPQYNFSAKWNNCVFEAKCFHKIINSIEVEFFQLSFLKQDFSFKAVAALRGKFKGLENSQQRTRILHAEARWPFGFWISSWIQRWSTWTIKRDFQRRTFWTPFESYNVDEDESSEELFSEEGTETASIAEGAPNKTDEIPSNHTVLLGEGISQISESGYYTALASTSSAEPNDVANTVEGYDNIEDGMQEYVNANCSGKWRFNSKHLRKIHIVVSWCKYSKEKCRPYCLFKISKMRRWSLNYIAICNHSKESSASVTLGE